MPFPHLTVLRPAAKFAMDAAHLPGPYCAGPGPDQPGYPARPGGAAGASTGAGAGPGAGKQAARTWWLQVRNQRHG